MTYAELCRSYSLAVVTKLEKNIPDWLIQRERPLQALRDLARDSQTVNEIYPLRKHLENLVASDQLIPEQIDLLLAVSELDAEMDLAIQNAFSAHELDILQALDKIATDMRRDWEEYDDERRSYLEWDFRRFGT